jgi:hypothetical protein
VRRETLGQVIKPTCKAVLEIAAERRNFDHAGQLVESYADSLRDALDLKPEEIAAKMEEIKARKGQPKGRRRKIDRGTV